MPRINLVDINAAGNAQEIVTAVKQQLGVVPNIFATMAQSPKVLEGFLAFSGALGEGELTAKTREQIALAVAAENSCDYCASAHSAMGKGAGLNGNELSQSLQGQSADAKTASILNFATKAVKQRGRLNCDDVAELRQQGVNDAELVEVIAHVGINLFTNYFNHIADTEIDFPLVTTSNA